MLCGKLHATELYWHEDIDMGRSFPQKKTVHLLECLMLLWFAAASHIAMGLQCLAGLFSLAFIILPWTVMLSRMSGLLLLQMYC